MEPRDVAIRLHSALHEVEQLLQEVDKWYHRVGEKSVEEEVEPQEEDTVANPKQWPHGNSY